MNIKNLLNKFHPDVIFLEHVSVIYQEKNTKIDADLVLQYFNILSAVDSSVRRKYIVFRMHASSLSHKNRPYTCEIHPRIRERIHAPSKIPYTTSSIILLT